LLKACRLPLAITIITLAMLAGVCRILTPWAAQYKPQLAHRLSILAHANVTIETMQTGWYWFYPTVKLKGVKFSYQKNTALKIHEMVIGIDLIRTFWHQRLKLSSIKIDGVKANIKHTHKHWQIAGLTNVYRSYPVNSLSNYVQIIYDILPHKVQIKHVKAIIKTAQNSHLLLKGERFIMVRRGINYHLEAYAQLINQKPVASIRLLANLCMKEGKLRTLNANGFMALKQADIIYLNPYLSTSLTGMVDANIWFDVQKGQIERVQSELNLKDVRPYHQALSQPLSLKANIAWQVRPFGWQLLMDKLYILYGAQRWPENALSLRHQTLHDTWDLYVKHTFIQPLLHLSQFYYKLPTPLQSVVIKGVLQELHVAWQAQQLHAVSTQFRQLSLSGYQALPKISGLNGQLAWQAEQGFLKLDSPHVNIDFTRMPLLDLKLNTLWHWQKKPQDIQISIDNLQVVHPNLMLKASGQLSDITFNKSSAVDMDAELSSKNFLYWRPFIEKLTLPSKLNRWLVQDIKKLSQLDATVKLKGRLIDFPFDKTPGVLSVQGHITGMNLKMAPSWPDITNIQANVMLNSRNLSFNVHQAVLAGLTLTQGQASITGLGLGNETLTGQTSVKTPASHLISYINNTPLKATLPWLNGLKISDKVRGELSWQWPLYGDKSLKLQGSLDFLDNKVRHRWLEKSLLTHVKGRLNFTEKGIKNSQLDAVWQAHPLHMAIKTLSYPMLATSLFIKSELSMAVLRQYIASPILRVLEGSTGFGVNIIIPQATHKVQTIALDTDLQGVAINLPLPLKKSAQSKHHLACVIRFNDDAKIKMHVDYSKLFNADLILSQSPKLNLEQVHVQFGSEKKLHFKVLPLFQIKGQLDEVDATAWQKVYQSVFPTTRGHFNSLPSISLDLLIKRLLITDKVIENVAIMAVNSLNQIWDIAIEHDHCQGEVHYDTNTQTLSGVLAYLKYSFKHQDEAPTATFKPTFLPNLDLTVQNLMINEYHLGQASLKAHQTAKGLDITDFALNSSFYQLQAQATWPLNTAFGQSDVDATLRIQNLASLFKAWQLHPALQAREGQVYFKGNWPGGLLDFSLAELKAQTYINLKHGYITHLNAETENKIGLGKLMSLLSIQTLPRRLRLDFSDLAQHGYSFDDFKGNFTLNQGVMSTKDSYMDGPIAWINIMGDVDMIQKLYDLRVVILPHVTSSLPVVATLAAGPIAGLATWAVSKIIAENIQKMNRYRYKITGSWDKPVVEHLDTPLNTHS